MSNALLLHVLAGVDGLDDRQIAGTPFPGHVPNYPALLSAAKSANALLVVGEKVPNAALGGTRKLRIGILKEGASSQTMDPRVAKLVHDAVKRFEGLGAEVVEVSVPEHSQVPTLGRIQRYEENSFKLVFYGSASLRLASNCLLGRHTGTRQMHMTDLNERLLPWSQEKFEKVFIAHSTDALFR
jgi:amidase